jgi:hypothetical protein
MDFPSMYMEETGTEQAAIQSRTNMKSILGTTLFSSLSDALIQLLYLMRKAMSTQQKVFPLPTEIF